MENKVLKEFYLFNENYFQVYYNGNIYNIKAKDIKLYLNIDFIDNDDVLKYMEKYYN